MPPAIRDVPLPRGGAPEGGALAAFLDLPVLVYSGDPSYVPAPRRETRDSLARPEFAGRQRLLLAVEGGRPQARLAARLSPRRKDGAGRPVGMMGFFEALPEAEEAVAALFLEARSWLEAAGAGEIVGPLDGDTWHRYRLNVGPHDAPPFLLEPYNPPFYPELWRANGFEVVERYSSKRVEAEAVVRHLAGRAESCLAAGYRLRPIDLGRFEDELRTLYRLSTAIFAGNYLYSEIAEERFLDLYRGAKALLDPRLVWFAHAPPAPERPERPEGGEVGFLFAYPDRVRALAAMRGRRDLPAQLRFLLRRDDYEAIDFKTLGVLREHRRSGVAAALFHRGHAEALALGRKVAHHCLFRDGNPSGDLDGGAGEILRRYELYRLPSPPSPLPGRGDGRRERGAGGEGSANVVAVLRDVARRLPHRAALVLGREAVSFAELWERIDRTSVGLRRAGLGPGDRAIVLIPMSIDLYVALLALLKIGAVAVFVDPWIGRRQIAAFAAFAEPRGFLAVARGHLLRLLEPGLRRIPVTATTGLRLGALPAAHALRELGREPGDGAIAEVAAGAPALITFTSGSSGEPKGANRTHRFLLAQGAALAAEFPLLPGDVDMPMFPVFALNNLAAGVTSVVPAMDFRRVEAVDGAAVLAQMAAYGVTTATASPPFFDRLAEALGRAPESPRPPLRRLLTGGAPVSDAQLRAWRAAFPETEIQVAYGSTEAEPVAHLTAEERLAAVNADRPATPGYCAGAPGGRIRGKIVRIHGGPIVLGAAGWGEWELPRGEIGELVVAGEHVGRDYYRNPRACAENKIVEAGEGGDATVWHRMGDTGSLDPEGRFWLAGRVHSTIWRKGAAGGGEAAIHPQLVEQAARGAGEGDPRLRRVALVGLPGPERGERAVLVLEAEGGGGEGLEADVRLRLEGAGLAVDEIVVAGAPLPLDPRHNSKIDYGRLRERLLRERGAAGKERR